MPHQGLAMSETAASAAATERQQLDAAVGRVRARRTEFARLSPAAKAELARELIPTVVASAEEWAEAGARAKGLRVDGPAAGEEWIAGPMLVVRNLRLVAESLDAIARDGKPPFGREVIRRPDGRLLVRVFPTSTFDKLLYGGFTGDILLEKGLSEEEARARQASFYSRKDPEGGVTLVLGAGNVSSIGPMDAFYKLFVEGNVCVLKMNPVNEYLGPIFEKALAPLVRRGYLEVVYGGGDVGAYLCQHPGVDDIHITGSDRTHDTIVWGPPGPERERRKAAKEPLLKKTISSELGNVSPVIVVPASYSRSQLHFQARNVVSMMTNNASFNCNAAKMLVTAKGWAQRDEFLGMIRQALSEAEPRRAYYPGAQDRYRTLTEGRRVERIGSPDESSLAWTLISGLDAKDEKDPLFTTEPFCSILSEVELPANDPADFLATATEFANTRLWGTLNASVIIHPSQEKDPVIGAALDRALLDLRYGTVAVNHWPALGYGFVSTPWGGHPSVTLEDIQSGLGWVHNTYMIEGIEKGIIRGPITIFPKPLWFTDNKMTREVARSMVRFEADPSGLSIPGLIFKALRG